MLKACLGWQLYFDDSIGDILFNIFKQVHVCITPGVFQTSS